MINTHIKSNAEVGVGVGVGGGGGGYTHMVPKFLLGQRASNIASNALLNVKF